MLGEREESLYGQLTLSEINSLIQKKADKMNIQVDFFQSNEEGKIVSRIQESSGLVDYIVINPAAFTHTSIAIRDALLAVKARFIEVCIVYCTWRYIRVRPPRIFNGIRCFK